MRSPRVQQQSDLDLGPVLPFDEVIRRLRSSAHVLDDFFKNKLAFTVLLNFPLTTLDERLKDGPTWTPPPVGRSRAWRSVSKTHSCRRATQPSLRPERESGQYIAQYNIWMYHLLDSQGQRLFPPKMRLLSHWNLRDEIKADYSDPQTGLAKQRMIQQVMERIVTQTIPASGRQQSRSRLESIHQRSPTRSGERFRRPAPESRSITNAPEPDTRYAKLQKTFLASEKLIRIRRLRPP